MRWLLNLTLTLLVAAPCWAADLSDAKTDFGVYCANCHGFEGKGNGPGAAGLDPRYFTNCADMAKRTDAELKKTIVGGGDATGLNPAMPAWGEILKPEQVDGLVAYIRSFCTTNNANK